jgi:hypothetical protein
MDNDSYQHLNVAAQKSTRHRMNLLYLSIFCFFLFCLLFNKRILWWHLFFDPPSRSLHNLYLTYRRVDDGFSRLSLCEANFVGSHRTRKDVGRRNGEAGSEEGEAEEGRHERAVLA